MPEFTRFKGVVNYGDSQLSNQLSANMIEFCNWAMLCIGAFYNVQLNSNIYGANPSVLRMSDDRRYPKGKAWDGYKSQWIWETNIEYPVQPIQISGIYVNNTFYPTGTSDPNFAYNISYPRGQVVFNKPIPTNSKVQCEYSHREVCFYSSDTEWYRTVLDRLGRPDDYQFNWQGSGLWGIFSDTRTALPAVVVESVPNTRFTPKALGGGQWLYQDVNFHIYADDSADRNILTNILSYQSEKKFYLFDQNAMAASSSFPLNVYGYLVRPDLTYPTLVQKFLWTDAVILDVSAGPYDNESPNIYTSNVVMTLWLDFPGL